MNLLLDSHVLVWMHDHPIKLSQAATSAIADSSNKVFLSVASVWELQIKINLGKLGFSDTLENVVHRQQKINGVQILPVQLSHALYLENLPSIHRDPFDRILICQALVENMNIVTTDRHFGAYGAKVVW